MEKQQILGESSLLAQTLEQLSLVAPLDKPVLIAGERGTGKELIAERLHFLSSRWQKPFIKINCAAISESLLESSLFGHEAGAFTGAAKANKGYFERANEGTLFLDELGTVSSQVQEKLLRVLEYGEFERLGGQQTLHADVRVIAASNADLVKQTKAGEFRADLLDRLAFDVINLPPLRYRKEDIPILAEHFAIAMSRELNRDVFMGFTKGASEQLLDYSWPGNVRELKNVVQRSVYRHLDESTALEQIVFDPFRTPWQACEEDAYHTTNPAHSNDLLNAANRPQPPKTLTTSNFNQVPSEPAQKKASNFKDEISEIEYSRLKYYLAKNHYHQKNTAQAIGLTYHQLRAYLRKYPSLID